MRHHPLFMVSIASFILVQGLSREQLLLNFIVKWFIGHYRFHNLAKLLWFSPSWHGKHIPVIYIVNQVFTEIMLSCTKKTFVHNQSFIVIVKLDLLERLVKGGQSLLPNLSRIPLHNFNIYFDNARFKISQGRKICQ